MVLEGAKTRNDITIFERTSFGENLHTAFSYFDAGLYVEAEPYWQEVIKCDGGYTYAHVGLGKADLKNQNYKSALDRFEIANDKDDYDKAFEYYREEWLRSHFTLIAVIIVVLIVLWIVHKILKKKGIKLIKRKKKEEK
jgi:tetratricopeptide (TPR) repeat protein